VFGAFISIEPGKTGALTFEYKLSDRVRALIAQGSYRLQFFKQNGAMDHALTLGLQFGKNVVRAIPPEEAKFWGDGTYSLETRLDQDREFYIGF